MYPDEAVVTDCSVDAVDETTKVIKVNITRIPAKPKPGTPVKDGVFQVSNEYETLVFDIDTAERLSNILAGTLQHLRQIQ